MVNPTINIDNQTESILNKISMNVRLNDYSNLELLYKEATESYLQDSHGCYKNKTLTFADREEKVTATLQFKMYEKITFAYVDAKINNERIQARHDYFASEESITIKMGDLSLVDGLMANYHHKDWWTRPFFGHDLSKVPGRTQSLLWKSSDTYYYLLPLIDSDFRAQLAGGGEDLHITLSSFAVGLDQCQSAVFAFATHTDPFQLSKQTIEKTLEVLKYPTLPRDKKRYPEILDYLGWCSWDAFYHLVSEKGLMEKMAEMKEKELPVKWVMVDDGWLDVEENRLRSFAADSEKFPDGLKSAVQQLKEQFGVHWVGVWHTITGYWGGIHPESHIAKEMSESLYFTNSNKLIPHPDASKGFAFWNKWHKGLQEQGIEFVKVDSQSAVNNFMMYQDSVGKTARGAHTALEASVGIHFDQCIINCMGMAAENVWNRPISSVSRNSDDFVPGDEISFKEHALQNAYNSYYHGHFYWGDWDMYWTDHEEDIQNAVLRAVSGGPVYFSDRVGETNADNIWPLILNDGKILRADQPGLPTADCLFVNPNEEPVPLKVWNKVSGSGVIAAFNIHLQGEKVKGAISATDVPGLEGNRFAIFDYFNKKVSVVKKAEKLDIFLKKDEVHLYLIIPLNRKINPIGLINKFLAPKTIERQFEYRNKTMIYLTEGGVLAFIADGKPKQATVNGKEMPITREDAGYYIIDCSHEREEIIVEIVRHDQT